MEGPAPHFLSRPAARSSFTGKCTASAQSSPRSFNARRSRIWCYRWNATGSSPSCNRSRAGRAQPAVPFATIRTTIPSWSSDAEARPRPHRGDHRSGMASRFPDDGLPLGARGALRDGRGRACAGAGKKSGNRQLQGQIDGGNCLRNARAGTGTVVAVDPHTSPATTDPDLRGKTTTYEDFVANLRTAGVFERVEIERVYSHELAREWKDSIRFLWIDGDHTYEGAKADLDMFKPYLVDGAIVAMHDVLGTFEGALRVFVEEVLDSDDFGAAGFSGSIGWAQYRPRDGKAARFRRRRRLLAVPARRLIPVARRADHGLHGWNKFLYKLWRPLAPHGDVSLKYLAAVTS